MASVVSRHAYAVPCHRASTAGRTGACHTSLGGLFEPLPRRQTSDHETNEPLASRHGLQQCGCGVDASLRRAAHRRRLARCDMAQLPSLAGGTTAAAHV